LREWTPKVSPDSKWVYYVQVGDGAQKICRISIMGGETTVIATAPEKSRAGIHDISRKDGRLAVEFQLVGHPNPKRRISIISPSGRAPTTSIELPAASVTAAFGGAGFVRWSPDGQFLIFNVRNDNSATSLVSVPVSGRGTSRTLLTLAGRINIFEFSPDGKQLAYVRGTSTRDAVLITNSTN
jgi:Tol biopolymer transport system component